MAASRLSPVRRAQAVWPADRPAGMEGGGAPAAHLAHPRVGPADAEDVLGPRLGGPFVAGPASALHLQGADELLLEPLALLRPVAVLGRRRQADAERTGDGRELLVEGLEHHSAAVARGARRPAKR